MVRQPDPRSQDILDWTTPQVGIGYSADVIGRGGLDNKIARVIAQALRDARDADLDRARVARDMSVYLGRRVSEAMLNKWSSEASEDHRIPLDAFIALVHATGANQLLGFAPQLFGLSVIASEYAAMVRVQMIREKRQQLEAEEAALMAQWNPKR